MNRVRLYSNGMAVISRDYELNGKPLDISIPVRSVDLCDAVGTLSVTGDVECPEPPNYEPVGANETSLTLDPQSVDRDLATKLAGAKILVKVQGAEHRGTLLGIQEFTEVRGDVAIENYRVSVRVENKFFSFLSQEIEHIEFLDEQVKSEIEKALQRSFSAIKPNSSFINLKVVPKGDARSCNVVYAIPAASWKIRYHLFVKDSKWSLNQQAVVDNDTDDDWRDTLISVVSGSPITFATDLAEIRRPIRGKVNVVADRAQGAVDMQAAIPNVVFPCIDIPSQINIAAPAGARAATRSVKTCSFPSDDQNSLMQMASGGAAMLESYSGAAPTAPEAAYSESGDFAVFDSPTPVTILSERSAIIPLDTSELDEGNILLLFNQKQDAERPFRALRFKNTTGQTFGKGVCEIIQDGELQGKAVLQGAKNDEEVNLVYAKETGVRVFVETHPSDQQVVGLKIGHSMAVWSRRFESYTDYKIENSKDEEFKFEIEHANRIQKSTFAVQVSDGENTVDVEYVSTPTGIRASFTLPEKAKVVVRVMEKGHTEQSISIGSGEYVCRWLTNQIINVTNPIDALTSNAQVKALLAAQEKIEEQKAKITEAESRVEEIDEDQERLSGLIDKFSSADATKYKTKLGENEEEREKLVKEKKPALVQELQRLESERNKLAQDFTLDWTA